MLIINIFILQTELNLILSITKTLKLICQKLILLATLMKKMDLTMRSMMETEMC